MLFPELESLSKDKLRKLLAIIILTDGSILIYKGHPRALVLRTVDYNRCQHLLFEELCKKVYGKRPNLVLEKIRNGKFLRSRLYSKNAALDLLKISPTYKTSPYQENKIRYLSSKQPTMGFIWNESKDFKWLVFRLWFDFEGSIIPTLRAISKKDKQKYLYYQYNFEAQFYISESNPNLVNELKRLAEELGLTAKIKKDKRKWSGIDGIRITKREDIQQIVKKGPLTNVKISGKSPRFKGIEKKRICSLIKYTFKNKISHSHYFKTLEEVKKFRNLNYKLLLKKLSI